MLSLSSLAESVGRCREVELASFRAVGARAIGGDASYAVFLSGASRAHGFRARLLEVCVPVASGFSELSPAPLPREINAVLDAICDGGDDRAVVDALVEAFYPALRDAYEILRIAASGPGDTFVRRTFRRCRDDVAGMLEEARALGATRVGGARARHVRALLDEAGGPFGSPGRGPGGTA